MKRDETVLVHADESGDKLMAKGVHFDAKKGMQEMEHK
jgi:hypothetical protein